MKIKEIVSVKTERKPGWLDRRFGEHFARISTVTTRKLKYAIRDVARFTYGKGMIPYDIERLAKAIQTPPQGVNDYDFVFGHEEAGRFIEGSVNKDPALKEYIKKYPSQWKIVVKCLSLVRSNSLHACGYVIASRPIREFMPLSHIKGIECTEFTANSPDGISSVEGVGGIKYDYLKLNSLRDIQIAVKLIQERSKVQMPDFINKNGRCPKVRILPYKGSLEDIWTSLPEESEVFSDIANGDTESVFQLSTQGALKWLKLFNETGVDGRPLISSVKDIAVFTALDRPGPLDIELTNPEDGTKHNALVEYVRRAKGLPPSKDIIEVFDSLFPETRGILCVAEGGLVKTSNGLVPIQLVKPGTMVQTESGSYRAVARCFNQGVKECVKVRMDGGEELIVTPDHKVLTNVGWVEAGLLTDQHLVRQYWLSENEILEGDDKDWIVGLLLADGDLTATTPVVACSDEVFANEVKRIADGAWGLDSVVVKYGRTWYCRLRHLEKPGTTRNPLTSFLREVGLLGLDCFSKRFPKTVTASMLAGFFEGDGSVKTNRLRVKNEALAREFFYGLQRMKIQSSLKEDHGVWTVSISSPGLPLRLKQHKKLRGGYAPRPGLSFVKKRDGHIANNHKRSKRPYVSRRSLRALAETYHQLTEDPNPWGRVLSVSQSGLHQVYDLEVDSEHSFVVGGSVVHNCFQEQLQRAYQTLTGCSGAEADEFRSNVAKKRAAKVAAAYETFVKRAGQTLGSEEKAAQVFQAFGTWSNYGFCLAHAVSYAKIAYVTAFLMRHFPLEWWTAVLTNATKDDISNKFWPKCSKIMDLPDISNPRDRFTIVNERIQAPIGMLLGVGQKAQEQIVAYAPYSSIDGFCEAIQKHKELNAITVTETKEVKGVSKLVSKKKLGRSAIHSGVVYSLIISGAMDSLFDPQTTLEEKLLSYEKAMAKASGAKKPKPVKPQFTDLNAYNQFLMRKKLLPVFTQKLPDLMVDCKHPLVSTTYGKPRYKGADRMVDLWELSDLQRFDEEGSTIPYGGYRAAIPGYVTSVRRFTFDGGKEGCAVALNIEGVNREFVKWPDWNSKKPDPLYDVGLENNLVVLHVVKRREDRPFVIENIEILASPKQKA